ncbi:11700_t:CDS:2 [Ambispora gerdemannii]|uniref:11700_t:CDS:1 n=1 Tax=Ambispora gerdemannii TaxID=144530 RepID=A0A9N9BEZ6_9GLOM|nr:11700_t:CDS:2 [Ambispora gerdemannii]
MIDSSNNTNANDATIISINLFMNWKIARITKEMRVSLHNIPAEMVPPVDVPFPPDINPKDLIRQKWNFTSSWQMINVSMDKLQFSERKLFQSYQEQNCSHLLQLMAE